MNIRKPTDYTIMFAALDALMAAQLPQMELYREIGRLVSGRAEKGAAVAASEYLQAAYPAAEGFSPRNVRRMRAFHAAYEESPDIMRLAMRLGWTRNVAILEGCGSNEERAWYIRAVLHFGWKKAKLLAAIESQAWLHSSLDEQAVSCYTDEKEVSRESECNEKDTLCVSWEYLPQPHGRVRDEKLGEESGAGVTIPYCDFPSEHWTRIRTNNVIERLNREIRRRTRVVGTFPDGNSALMLVCARLRHVAGTQWGCKKYMNMKHLEAALDNASIAG